MRLGFRQGLAAAAVSTFLLCFGVQAADAAKIAFASGTTKSFTGNLYGGSHVFTATGTGGQLRVTCTGATFTGTATLNATSATTSASYSGCTSLYGGAQFATTVTGCTYTLNFANATVDTSVTNNPGGIVYDNGGAGTGTTNAATITVAGSPACEIRINANCTLVATGGPYRFNTDGRPADDGVYSGATGGTFPAWTNRNAVRAYAKVQGITVGTKSGSNCTAFGFAAFPATVSNGQYFGTNTPAGAASGSGRPSTSNVAAVQINDLWLVN